jgi:hypothetical protein
MSDHEPLVGEIGIDWSEKSDETTFVCSCGWQTDKLPALIEHLKAHGVTRVTVRPETMR